MPEIKWKQVLKCQKVPECEIHMATEHIGGTWNLFVWEGGGTDVTKCIWG